MKNNSARWMGRLLMGLLGTRKSMISGVIDSTKAGMDAGKCLDGIENGIPIFRDIDDAIMDGQEWGSEFTLRSLWSLALHSHFVRVVKQAGIRLRTLWVLRPKFARTTDRFIAQTSYTHQPLCAINS